ncbi:MAG: NAD+ synthase, partial [Alphaproteobacteria bacterium]|nr:NAD+ synthase [Alphaproteobacteria bacterium]
MSLTFSIAQINPTVGDLSGNAQKILDVWQTAKTDLVIFPELILSGYPTEDLVLKPSFMDGIESVMERLKQDSVTFQSAALVTTPWRINGRIYNTAHLIEHGQTRAITCKHHLPNYGVFDERRVFSAGPLPEPILFRGHALGVMICEDMWFTDVAAYLKAQGAEILIVPNASPFDATKHQRRLKQAQDRVQKTGLPLIYAHFYGGQDDLVFDGGSFV